MAQTARVDGTARPDSTETLPRRPEGGPDRSDTAPNGRCRDQNGSETAPTLPARIARGVGKRDNLTDRRELRRMPEFYSSRRSEILLLVTLIVARAEAMLSAFRHARVLTRRSLVRPLTTTPTEQPPPPQEPTELPASILDGPDEYVDPLQPPPPPPVQMIEVAAPPAPGFQTIPPAEDPLLHMFTSCIMQDGQRHKASRTTSQVLLHLHAYTRQPPLELFRQALYKAAPAVRNMKQRRGGKALIKPIPLSEKQRMRTAIDWLWDVVNVRSSSATTGRTIAERTAREMIKILNGDSSVLKQKESVHKLALANRGS
ncbi:hypothetical protein EIP91_009946 [Steccherinum ochraceum]|uniref:Small ribosomal subunit protein uS7 domain-containing protein n=1 Tax=Steccherinum ochraceum TaxID=92696 RepID=A0A4R0R934_9APHY|nr:hypothetical protein EIP91_009946 [Steccherinum ochraceum]